MGKVHIILVSRARRTPCPRQRRSCRALRERRHRRRLKSPRLRQRHCRLLRRNTTRQPVAMRCRAFIIERVPRRFFHHHRQSSRSRPRSAPSSSRVCPPRPPPRETIPPPPPPHILLLLPPNNTIRRLLLLKGSVLGARAYLPARGTNPKPPRTRRCARRVTGAKRSNWSTKNATRAKRRKRRDSGTNRK